MNTIEIAIGSASDPMVIESTCGGNGIEWYEITLPEWSLRMTYAPPSQYVSGNILLSAVDDSAEMVVLVTAEASSASDLEVKKMELENALRAWPGEVTVTLVEESGSTVIGGPWQSFPTRPRWGEMRALLNGVYLQDGAFSIPVNPIGAP